MTGTSWNLPGRHQPPTKESDVIGAVVKERVGLRVSGCLFILRCNAKLVGKAVFSQITFVKIRRGASSLVFVVFEECLGLA